jgi:Protein of unknown function (DUF3224)
LTRASVSQRFEGDLAGDGTAEWVMAYQADGRARFAGFQVVDGELAGHHGTLMLETLGEFDGRVTISQGTLAKSYFHDGRDILLLGWRACWRQACAFARCRRRGLGSSPGPGVKDELDSRW